MSSDKTYVVSYDMYGLESVVPITDMEQQGIMDALISGSAITYKKINQTIEMILLRARVNMHRRYEVYAIAADPSLNEQDIRDFFTTSPQSAADWCRKNGQKLYSDRASEDDDRVLIR